MTARFHPGFAGSLRRSKRPPGHRKPSRLRRMVWHLGGYTLATLAGALAHHLAMILL